MEGSERQASGSREALSGASRARHRACGFFGLGAGGSRSASSGKSEARLRSPALSQQAARGYPRGRVVRRSEVVVDACSPVV